MKKIKHLFRLTIIENEKKTIAKIFPNYKKAFSFCGQYFIKKYGGLSWSRDLQELIKYTEVKNSNKYKETVFIKHGFTRKSTKNFQIFIDEIFEGTEKHYPPGKNMHTKHHFFVKLPDQIMEINSTSYQKGYGKVGDFFQRIAGMHWSYSCKYLLSGYEKTPYFIEGKMNHKIKRTTVTIKPI